MDDVTGTPKDTPAALLDEDNLLYRSTCSVLLLLATDVNDGGLLKTVADKTYKKSLIYLLHVS